MSGIEWIFGGTEVSLWLKCKGATELASQAMDQTLPLQKRFALKLHHLVCLNCARYAKQLHEIRRLISQDWARDNDEALGLSPEAAVRIETELHKKLES